MEREGGGSRKGLSRGGGELSDTLTLHFQVERPLQAPPLAAYNTHHIILTQPLQVFLSDNVSTLKRALIVGGLQCKPN